MDHNRQVHILPRSQSQETDPARVCIIFGSVIFKWMYMAFLKLWVYIVSDFIFIIKFKAARPYHYAPSLGPPMMEGGGLPSQRWTSLMSAEGLNNLCISMDFFYKPRTIIIMLKIISYCAVCNSMCVSTALIIIKESIRE